MRIEIGEAGFPVMLVETSELIHSRRALTESGAVVIALSQSGRGAEIVRLPDSPLAQCARATVRLNAGTGCALSARTYMASLAALGWLSEALRGAGRGTMLRESAAAPQAAPRYLDCLDEHVEEAAAEVVRRRSLVPGRPRPVAGRRWYGRVDHRGAGPFPRRGDERGRLAARPIGNGGAARFCRARPLLDILARGDDHTGFGGDGGPRGGAFCRATKATEME
jgi:hypothetical protein